MSYTASLDRMTLEEKYRPEPARAPANNGGCYVSTVKGFILLLLAIIIAIVVGILVYLIARKDVDCKVTYPVSDGAIADKSQQEQLKYCDQLATSAQQCMYYNCKS